MPLLKKLGPVIFCAFLILALGACGGTPEDGAGQTEADETASASSLAATPQPSADATHTPTMAPDVDFVSAGNEQVGELLGGLDEPRIPDEKTAARVAEAYFYSVFKKEYVDQQKPFIVTYDSVQGVWHVEGQPTKGGTYMIYLQQETGEVLLIGISAD